jgi:hypothetical protein
VGALEPARKDTVIDASSRNAASGDHCRGVAADLCTRRADAELMESPRTDRSVYFWYHTDLSGIVNP